MCKYKQIMNIIDLLASYTYSVKLKINETPTSFNHLLTFSLQQSEKGLLFWTDQQFNLGHSDMNMHTITPLDMLELSQSLQF